MNDENKLETTVETAQQQPDEVAVAAPASNCFISGVEKFLSSKYDFRKNLVTEKIEYCEKKMNSYVPMVGRDYNSLYRLLQKNGHKMAIANLRTVLDSDFVVTYDPFKKYFEGLPKWDEKTDYITELSKTVKTTNDAFWRDCFKRWIVALVACAIDETVTNHTVIVFAGKQGLGKTTWHLNIIPDCLKDYRYSGTINPANKDSSINLSECILINLDELESLNKSQLGELKEMITKSAIRIRRPYGFNSEKMIRRASFTGSVNQATFLNDTTGSRRFLCFTVTEIAYPKKDNLDLVYAQALHLFKNGFKYWFDGDEIQKIEQNNEKYQQAGFEEELLVQFFAPETDREKAVLYSATEVAHALANYNRLAVNSATVNNIGKALSKRKFVRVKSGASYKYLMRRIAE